MKRAVAVLATGLALIAAPARAQVTFDFIFDGGYPIAVSDNGAVIAGNYASGGFGPFRWTQATGPASLGRVVHVGGGGVPDISADGTIIASTIASLDSSYTTQGVWTIGSGWQELMPPAPADGGTVDGSYGSIWGLSGDGTTAVGLYWRPGVGKRAHASKWTAGTGVVDLGGTVSGQASRANGVNYDGSVIAGWVETPTGPWRPAAWVDGTCVLLTDVVSTSIAGTGEAKAVTHSGDIIVGFAFEETSGQSAATMWKRTNGVFGAPQILGWIEGSEPGYGKTIPFGTSSDGRVVVGWASYYGDPFDVTGFIWTDSSGVVDINTYLANNGILVDPNFKIKAVYAITPDGTQMFGYGQMQTPPYTTRAFRIGAPNLLAAPPSTQVTNLELSAPSPNPSSGNSRLDFALATSSSADLSIFDAAGRRVATLVHADLEPGRRSATWDGRDASGRSVSAGLYLARLLTREGAVTRRVLRVN